MVVGYQGPAGPTDTLDAIMTIMLTTEQVEDDERRPIEKPISTIL